MLATNFALPWGHPFPEKEMDSMVILGQSRFPTLAVVPMDEASWLETRPKIAAAAARAVV